MAVDPRLSRPAAPQVGRRVVCGLAVAGGAATLVACGSDTGTTTTSPGASGEQTPDQTPGGTGGQGGGDAIAAVADVPVGGALILEGIVLTQPTEGEIRGFDPTCSHQGCAVSQVDGDEIVCTCHFSKFSITDGAVVDGPAPDGLAPIDVTVDGDQVVRS